MTRWKLEPRTTLLLMHAHNRWSHWNGALLDAAGDLGLLVGTCAYSNCSGDGSTDREWYVSTAQLERVGGMQALKDRASELHEQRLGAPF